MARWIFFGFRLEYLRAEDGQTEGCEWQFAQSVVAVVGIVSLSRSGAKAAETSMGSGQDSHDDETDDKHQIKEDQQPAQEFWCSSLQAEIDKESDNGVEGCSSEDTLDSTG